MTLRLDEVRRMLPSLSELRPVEALLTARSLPDPGDAWTGSGELTTEASRLVDSAALDEAAPALARAEAAHLEALYASAARAVQAMGSGDAAAAGEALLDAAALEEARGRADRAVAWAESAWRTARNAPDRRTAARAMRRWARALRAQGRLGEAGHRYRQGFDVATALGDARGSAEAAVGLGNVLEQQGRWGDAETWYRRALEALDGIDAPVPERWHALLNLHVVLRSRGAVEASLEYLDEAEAEVVQLGAADEAAPFLENARGQLRAWTRDFARAEEHFRRALAATDDPAATTVIRLNLAEALLAQERLLDAGEQAREAERVALAHGVLRKLPEAYRLLGRIASARGEREAFVLFEHALERVPPDDRPAFDAAVTLQAYAEHEARHGDPEAAARLRELAAAEYRAIGIEQLRAPWTDVFGEADPSSPPAPHPDPTP